MAMAQALLRRSCVLVLVGRNNPLYHTIQPTAAAFHKQPQLIRCVAKSISAAPAALCWSKGSREQGVFACSRHSSSSSTSSRKKQVSVRNMSSASDGGLLKVLKTEIDYETKQDKAQEVEKTPPKPYTLHDKPGTQEVILRRSYGREEIAITCVFQSDPYADDNDDDDDDDDEDKDEEDQGVEESVGMTVSLTKGGEKPALEISCVTSGDGISIERVAYLVDGSDKDMLYEGPDFENLEEELQKQFQKFLEARGVNEELAQFLMQYMPEKERQEYVYWLKNVESFVKA